MYGIDLGFVREFNPNQYLFLYRWIYVSNAEVSNGGVGAITFNGNGDVIDYKMIMTGTSTNCGGGKTYWGTWVSCEESSGGQGSYNFKFSLNFCTLRKLIH